MEQVIFYPIPLEKLLQEIKKIVQEVMDERDKTVTNPLLGRKEVCERFGISLVTLHRWTNLGLIECHRAGGRIYYKQEAVDRALKSVSKYKHL